MSQIKKVLYVREISKQTGRIISNKSTTPNELLQPFINNLYNHINYSVAYLNQKISMAENKMAKIQDIHYSAQLEKYVSELEYGTAGINELSPFQKMLSQVSKVSDFSSFSNKSHYDLNDVSNRLVKVEQLEKDLYGLIKFVSRILDNEDIDIRELSIVIKLIIDTVSFIGKNSSGTHSNTYQKEIVVKSFLEMIERYNSRIDNQVRGFKIEAGSFWSVPNSEKQEYIQLIERYKISEGEKFETEDEHVNCYGVIIDYSR